MRILIVDNFDSFTYNIAQTLGALGAEPVVIRNDRPLQALREVVPAAVVISPGPGTPEEAGVSVEAIDFFSRRGVPVLGVCLGHQCIAAMHGGRVRRAPVGPVHGKTSLVSHLAQGLLHGVPSPFTAIRYHSLAVDEEGLPAELDPIAWSEDGTIMALAHAELPLHGVQFHPESILTQEGPRIFANFLGLPLAMAQASSQGRPSAQLASSRHDRQAT